MPRRFPARRRSRRTRTRKSWRRPAVRRRRVSSKTTIRNSRPSAVIADRFITKMKYAERFIIPTAAPNSTAAQLFNLNSVFDPDRTGIGHQPWGRDQLASLYHRYRVFAVSWRITFFAANALATFVVVPLNNELSIAGKSLSEIRELPRAIAKVSSSTDPTTFIGRISLAKLNGQTATEYKGGERFQSLFNDSPVELMTLQAAVNSIGGSGFNYQVDCQLTYHVEWFDPVPVGQS